jgi:hypothetical protein
MYNIFAPVYSVTASDILRVEFARNILFTEVGGVMHVQKLFLAIRLFICHVSERLRTEFLILCKEKFENF